MSKDRNTYTPDEVSAPGDTLADVLAERSLTRADLAARLGRPRKPVNEIIQGNAAITPEMAIQLERALGTPASFWLAREHAYRKFLAQRAGSDRGAH